MCPDDRQGKLLRSWMLCQCVTITTFKAPVKRSKDGLHDGKSRQAIKFMSATFVNFFYNNNNNYNNNYNNNNNNNNNSSHKSYI